METEFDGAKSKFSMLQVLCVCRCVFCKMHTNSLLDPNTGRGQIKN